jgi:thymidylate kinase
LDGSGKTTVARQLCCLVGQTRQFQAVRYFHWRPSLLRQNIFPLSSTSNKPRKTALKPNAVRSLISAMRLFKNLILTKLAWSLNIRKLLHRNTLIIMDRYFYNYYLDPVSVRYYGPTWLVDKMRPAYPKPDWIVVLDAPPATLRARKQELSEMEIQKQSAVLQKIASDSPNSIIVDATLSPEEIAREILSRIATPQPPAQKGVELRSHNSNGQ